MCECVEGILKKKKKKEKRVKERKGSLTQSLPFVFVVCLKPLGGI